MRFITQYPGMNVQVRQQRQEGRGDGTVAILAPGLYATFTSVHDGAFIYENELSAALKHFNFHGNTQHVDEATPTDPVLRLALCDTDELAQREGWSPEDKALAEQKLRELAAASPMECLLVEEKPIEAPFPAYDAYDGDIETLVLRLIEDGFDLDRVLYYEQVFGPNRPDVIATLEEAIEAHKAVVIEA